MPTISISIMSWMISLLAFAVLIFFVFAMILYQRRCISSMSRKYPDVADLSTAIHLLEADKTKLEEYLAEQKAELIKVQGEREEQESVRQDILAQQARLKDLESAVEGLIAMQVEKRELEAKMADKRRELEELEEKHKEVLQMKEDLPEIRCEYEQLQKALERKVDIDAAINVAEAQLAKNEAQLREQEKSLAEQQIRLDEMDGKVRPLEMKRGDLEKECSELGEQLRGLLGQVAEAQAQFTVVNAQLPELCKQLEDREMACRSAVTRLEKLEGQRSNLEDRCRELEKKGEVATQKLGLLQQQLAESKTEFEALNAQLPGLRKEVHSMGLQIAGGDPEKDSALEELMCRPLSLVSRRFVQDVGERDMLQEFRRALHGVRLQFPDRTINAFHTSLKCQDINPLTVLAGVSGTGKTLLPVKYAEFMGINQIILSVQPRWDSAQDLFGFYNYLERRYKATELSRCLLRMDPYSKKFISSEDINIRNGLLMVLLDEMNLARPEYYFSEFLSKLELRRTVDPGNAESRNRASIELDTGTGRGSFSIWVPKNILFVGTMNEDESTQTLSDKVLDRANVLRFGKPARRKDQKKPLMDRIDGRAPISNTVWESWKRHDIQQYADACGDWTRKLNEALSGIGRAFGFRVEEAIYSYVANYPDVRAGSESMRWAFADQVEQKILPKLRGCDMTMNASVSSLDIIEDVIRELDDAPLVDAFRIARENAGETGIFLWQGVTRS